MKHVRLRMTADGREEELHPTYDLIANASFVEYATAVNWNVTGDELGIVNYVEGDVAAFEAALREIEPVREYAISRAGDDAFYVYVRDELTAEVRELWGLADRSGVVTLPPIEYHPDGTVTISLFGPSEEIQGALGAVPDPVSITVEEVSGMQAIPHAVRSSLTDRQHEAVEAAVDVGYYDVPRSASQDDVADRLDCASSTAAEHLRKAEAKVLRSLFG